jgi:hypothetical protein
MPPCSAIGWDGVSQMFCMCWPQTAILWISASQIAGMTGMSPTPGKSFDSQGCMSS